MTLLGNLCAEAGVKPVLDAPVNENLKIVERSASDGLFVRSGLFYVLPKVSLKPLEELFRARVITFLLEKGLLPPDRARMLRGWIHSGFPPGPPLEETRIAVAGCYPMNAMTWSVSPNTSSAIPSPWRRCRSTARTVRVPMARSSTAPA